MRLCHSPGNLPESLPNLATVLGDKILEFSTSQLPNTCSQLYYHSPLAYLAMRQRTLLNQIQSLLWLLLEET